MKDAVSRLTSLVQGTLGEQPRGTHPDHDRDKPSDVPRAPRACAFFDELEGFNPVVLPCTSNTHPDKVLRKLGIIETHARLNFGDDRVFFSSDRQEWLAEDSVKPRALTHRTRWGVHSRVDRTPKAVIQVIGEAGWIEEDKEKQRGVVKQRIIAEKRRREDGPCVSQAEENSEYEAARLIEQYVVSGLPEAAKKTEAMIIAKGTGRLSQLVGRGVHVSQDQGVGWGFPTTHIRLGRTIVLGISREVQNLCPHFTHHLIVRNSAKYTEHYPVSSPKGRRTGEEKKSALGEPVQADNSLTESQDAWSQEQDSDEEAEGLGYDTAHFELHDTSAKKAFTFGAAADTVVPFRRKTTKCNGFVCACPGGDHPCFKLLKHEEFLEGDMMLLSGYEEGSERAQELQALVLSQCTCGKTLGFFEIGKCKCGRYDFEHISWVQKRRRHLMIRKSGILKDPFIIDHLAFFCGGVVRVPDRREVSEYAHRLVTILSRGFSHSFTSKNIRHRGRNKNPPTRTRVPVVTVFAGGDMHDKFVLAKHVHKRWPIVVIEGTGGYADHLCQIVDKVHCIVLKSVVRGLDQAALDGQPNTRPANDDGNRDKTRKVLAAGLDDYRVFLSSIDSVTAEILINGHIDIARRGTNPKEFVRKVENAIQGNEVLTKAWLLYAQWITNAERQQARYFSGERLIILLSTVLTAMSVFHTFLLLINDGGTAPPFVPEEANALAIVWIIVPWSVIILPIVISGTIALTRVLQPGPKWVVLKSCSEQLLSEIYKYRTRTSAYSKESIAEHVRGAVDAQYTTPEELLQVKAADLIEVLNGSVVASVTLEQYEGMIPPPWIRATADSGFGLLSPDVYRDVRIDYNQRFVGCKARTTSLLKGRVECSELFMSALATFLAVAANFGYPYVACWTVLAICISTNMSKWLSNTRIGVTVQRLNTTANKLSTVSMWWTGLGPSADRQSNRNTLVEETEAAILDLELMWGSIISQGDGRQKTKPPERDNAKVKKPVQSLKSVGAKHGVDLEVLTSANLFDVVSDPNTGHKENVLKSAAAVLGALGKSVDGAASTKHRAPGTTADDDGDSSTDDDTSDTPSAVPAVAKKTTQEHRADALTGLVCTRSDMLCRALMEAIPSRREVVSRVTWLVKSRRTATKWLLINGIEGGDHPKARQALQGYTTRQLLELLKHITILELFETLPRYDEITPCSSKAGEAASAEQPDFTSVSYWRETVVSELYLIVTSSIFIDDAGVRGLLDEPMRLVKLVRSASLRQYLMCLKADRIFEIIESARRWIDHRSDSLLGRTVSMFRTTTFRIAEHDCESFLESKQTRLDVWKKIETILTVVTSNTWTQMARMNLLGLFPHNVQQRILNVTRLQLGRYLEIIARGTPASRVFSASHEKYDAILRDTSEAGQLVPHIFHPVHGDRELRERVVLLSMELSQIDINKCNKGQLRRKVNCTGVTNEALNHILFELLPDERLRFFLSVLQAKLNNTFTLKMIDRLGDDDLMNLNASALTHVAENLVSGTAVFKGGPPVSQMSKPEIICSFGKKSLHNVLEPLSECQLRTLVQDVLSASCKLYPLFVYAKVLELYPLFQRHHLREITFAWDPGFVTLLIDSCALVSPSTLGGYEESTVAGATSLGEVVPVWASATVTTTATAATVATTAHTTGTTSTTKSIGTHGNAQPPDYAVPALEEIDFDNVRVEVTKLLIALKQEGIDDAEGQAFLRGVLSTIRENSGDIMLAEIMEDAAVSLLVSPEVVTAIYRFEHGDVPSTARSSSSGRTGGGSWQGGKRSSSRLRKGRKASLAGSGSHQRPVSPLSEPSAADTGSTPRGRTTFGASAGRPSFDMTSLDNICSSEAMTVIVDLFMQEESQRDGLLTLVSQLVDRTDYFDTPSAPYHKLLNATTADILSAMRPDLGSVVQPSSALQPTQPKPATSGMRTPPRVPALPPIAHSSSSLVSGPAEDDPETIKLFSVYQKLSVASEWSSDSLRRVVMSCFNSLLFGAPMRLFYELSRRLRTIDIRDIIVGVSHRRLLVFYLFDILHLRLVGPDDVIYPSVTYTTSLEWNGLPQREVPHTHHVPKRNDWRTRLFKESVKLYGGIYRDVVDALRILTEAQMKLVVEEAARLFEDCEVAHFFVSYLEKVRAAQHCVGGDSAAWRKWLLWYCTVHDLRCRYAKFESAEAFATHFAGFDAEAFMSKPKEARQMSFTKLQLSCEKQAELFTYSAEQAEAELFFFINPASFGPPIRRATALDGIRKMRAAFWKHIQPIQQASPHGADRRPTAGQR